MKFLIVDHYYPNFLSQFATRHPDLPSLSYKKHLQKLLSEQFGTADFYSHALKIMGHEVRDVIVNYDLLQGQWAKESGLVHFSFFTRAFDYIWQKVPFLSSRKASLRQLAILASQVQDFRPDVLYVQIPTYFPNEYLRQFKQYVGLIVGQIASPIPPLHNFRGFDIIITSLPHFVNKFKKIGLKAEYLPLCFDPRVLSERPQSRPYPLTFVGSFFGMHQSWLSYLNQVVALGKLKIWGSPASSLDPVLRKAYQGEAWGKQMYNVLQKSQITLNRHSSVASSFANNMRLFEATGCGAMLITDDKTNLSQFFKPGQEIITYKNSKELCELIAYYSQHREKRAKIARAGQKRTLRDHTYTVRMKQLVKILEKYL